MEQKVYRSIREAARSSGASECFLRGLLKQGKLPGFYTGRKFLVNYPALCALLEQQSKVG